MPVDLAHVIVAVPARTTLWAGLGVLSKVRPIDPNHRKAVAVYEFESTTWLGDLTVWETDEAALTSVRKADDWTVKILSRRTQMMTKDREAGRRQPGYRSRPEWTEPHHTRVRTGPSRRGLRRRT